MIRRTSLALVAALLVAPLALGKPDRPSQLEPLPDQGKTAAFTMYTLSRVHYRSVPLDDTLSTQIYEAYLESMGEGRLVQSFKSHLTSTTLGRTQIAHHAIGLDDWLTWKAAYGSTSLLNADGNANGIIDAGDYVVWRNNYVLPVPGSGSGSLLGGPAVPEPSSAMLALFVVEFFNGLVARRRPGRA